MARVVKLETETLQRRRWALLAAIRAYDEATHNIYGWREELEGVNFLLNRPADPEQEHVWS